MRAVLFHADRQTWQSLIVFFRNFYERAEQSIFWRKYFSVVLPTNAAII